MNLIRSLCGVRRNVIISVLFMPDNLSVWQTLKIWVHGYFGSTYCDGS